MMRVFLPALIFMAVAGLWRSAAALADQAPYQPQHPQAVIGGVKVKLVGPPGFMRFDGQYEALDNFLVAAQPPDAAVLAFYADTEAWGKFQGDGEKGVLPWYAVVTSPVPLAQADTTLAEFQALTEDVMRNLGLVAGQAGAPRPGRDLSRELGEASGRKVTGAKGDLSGGRLVARESGYFSCLLESETEVTLKGDKKPRRAKSQAVSTMLLVGGKVVHLQIISADEAGAGQGVGEKRLLELAEAWRLDFLKANSGLKNKK